MLATTLDCGLTRFLETTNSFETSRRGSYYGQGFLSCELSFSLKLGDKLTLTGLNNFPMFSRLPMLNRSRVFPADACIVWNYGFLWSVSCLYDKGCCWFNGGEKYCGTAWSEQRVFLLPMLVVSGWVTNLALYVLTLILVETCLVCDIGEPCKLRTWIGDLSGALLGERSFLLIKSLMFCALNFLASSLISSVLIRSSWARACLMKAFLDFSSVTYQSTS